MKNWKMPLAVVLAVALVAGAVWAGGESLMQGQDSTGTVRYLLVDSSGRIVTTSNASGGSGSAAGTHGACTQTSMSVANVNTKCPPSPLATRSTISIQMTSSSLLGGVGVNGSTTTAGFIIGQYDIFTDNLAGNVDAYCICSAAGPCSFNIIECP